MAIDVSVIGFGDNVVDKYEHIKTIYPGGNTVNVAVYAKMCGAKRSAYMGIFGNDCKAEHVIASLAAEEIETYKCKQVIGENGCARVTIIDSNRIFLGSNEGGVRGESRYVLDRFDLEYIKGFDILHTGNYCFTERELYKIKGAGVPISFDFSDDSTPDYYQTIAPFVNFAFMSCGDMHIDEIKAHIKKVHHMGPKFVCASRGSHGSLAYDGNNWYQQPAVKAEIILDTMGAGDALLSSFLVHYLNAVKNGEKSSNAIAPSMQKAAEFAAKVCGIEGAWGHPLHYEEA